MRARRVKGRLWWGCACVALACTSIESPPAPGGFSIGVGAAASFCEVGIVSNAADNDGDGIPDHIEGIDDVDGDTLPNYRDLDSDGDGLPDAIEVGDPCAPRMCGSTVTYLSPDSDGDGILDADEAAGELCSPPNTGEIGSVSATATGSGTLGMQVSSTTSVSTGANTLGTGGISSMTTTGTTGAVIADGGAAGEGGEGGVSSFETQH